MNTDPDDVPFLRRLRRETPLVAAEFRPPRRGGPEGESLTEWIDLHHAMHRLERRGTPVFLTDDAVGEMEEENLLHLTANLAGDMDPSLMAPFLTCKHSLEYCLGYADRAWSAGVEALVVLGGDTNTGPDRCVEHAYQLRRRIRDRTPGLALGGWANPHRDPDTQAGYLADDAFTAEFYLTQVVSHHHLDRVEAFREAVDRRGIELPGVFGVFYYRSANPDTLRKLSRFFPVPAEEVTRAFERGESPEEICARTIRRLRSVGVRRFYVSNLGAGRAAERLERVLEAI